MNTSKSVMKCSENKSQIGRGGIQLPPNKRYIDDQEIKDINKFPYSNSFRFNETISLNFICKFFKLRISSLFYFIET